MVRKGTGITGSGTQNISPHLSGRLTLKMLKNTKITRETDNKEFDAVGDNEVDMVKQLLKDTKKIK